jgi:serine/threonine protein kinase/tetratricopeptide (TPR) repeat protein
MNEANRGQQPESWLGTVIDKKYRLISLIGEGGMAMVFLAERLHLRDMVAIKVLRPRPSSNQDVMLRFQIEAAAAAKVKHPNVVTIYDFGITDSGVVYIVMELLEGPGLDLEMRRYGQMPVERALEILKPVCSALDAAHSLGLLHRDIKPSNIILHRGRYDISEVVKVVDFGIAKFSEANDLVVRTTEGIVLGTAEYMSPEQCQGFPLDGRSDIYSLAMVFYQMLSGRVAFDAQSTGDFLIKQVKEPPLPLSRFCSELPKQIEAVVMQALAKDPHARPPNALEFYSRLEAAAANADPGRFTVGTGSPRSSESTKQPAIDENRKPTPKFNCFAGRSGELSCLIEAWHTACSGGHRPFILLGEPGIGKTQLLEETCHRVAQTGAYTLQGRFYESSGVRSFIAIIADLKTLLNRAQSNPEQMSEIFGDGMERMIQQLGRDWRTGNLIGHISDDDQETRLQFFGALAQAFSTLSRHRPVLLALDDLHWADESAREFLAYLAHNTDRERILIIATARPSGEGESFKAWFKNFRRECEVLPLAHFNKQQAFEVLEAIFGRVAITEKQFYTLLTESGGNPYFLVELLRMLLAENRIKFNGTRWVFLDLDVRLPQSLVDLVELIVERMSPEAKHVLSTAAVVGEEFDPDLLQFLVKSDEEALDSLLRRGVENGLISHLPARERYRFNNTTIRRVLYDSQNKRMRRRLHRTVAEWLEGNRSEPPLFELAYHYYQSGELISAFRYAVLAADAARESFQIDELCKYLVWAEESLALMERAQSLESDALAGYLPADPVECGMVNLLATYRWLCGLSLVYRSRDDLAEEHLQRASSLAGMLDNHWLLGQICVTLGTSRIGSGTKSEAIDYFKQALEWYRQANNLEGQGQSLRSMSALYEQRGEYTLALDCARAAVDTARACDNRSLESFSLSSEAWMLCKLRRFEESALVARKALALARKAGDRAARCSCYNTVAEIYAEQGLYEEAIRPQRESLKIARALGNRRFELILTANLGEIYLRLGKYPEAEHYLLKVLKLLEVGSNRLLEQRTLQGLARVYVRLKKLPQAQAYIARAGTLGASMDILETRCEFFLAAAELLLAEGKHQEAIHQADEAITRARVLGSLENEWLLWLIKARAFIALGEVSQARDALVKCIVNIERAAETITDQSAREKYLAYEERRMAFELYEQLS